MTKAKHKVIMQLFKTLVTQITAIKQNDIQLVILPINTIIANTISVSLCVIL